jgi:hypothetical protein
MTKKYKDLVESFRAIHIAPPVVEVAPTNESEEIDIGDTVQTVSGEIAEVISHGPNYVTLIKDGRSFKAWTKDVTHLANEDTQKRSSQLFKESFIVKGYKTKNFTRELSEQFKSLSQKNDDVYAIYNSVVCLDFLLGMTENSLKENYQQYKVSYDRATRYFRKFNLSLSEMSNVEDILLAYAIEEDLKFTSSDKIKVASIIAATAGVESNGDPISVINAAARKFKSGSHTPEAWKIIGKVLNKATQAGIKWDKNIFAKHTLKFMEIEA